MTFYCKINFLLTATIKYSKNNTFLCEVLFKMSFEKNTNNGLLYTKLD